MKMKMKMKMMASSSSSSRAVMVCQSTSPLLLVAHPVRPAPPALFRFRFRFRSSISVSCSITRSTSTSTTTRRIATVRCLSALTPELRTTLDKVVTSHKVLLFMKGSKDFPQCGFSNTVVQILKSQNVPFETVNILENEILRQGLKDYSNWPTFPQLYIDGEFFGGCDITVEAYQNGQLQELLEKAFCS